MYIAILKETLGAFLIPLLISLGSVLTIRKIRITLDVSTIYWLLLFVVLLGIQLPWKFTLERYLYSFLFPLLLFCVSVFSKITKYLSSYSRGKISFLGRLVVNILFIVLGTNLFFYSYPHILVKNLNYSIWYGDYLRFEYEQVEAINNANSNTVYINAKDNLNNWEVLNEIPIHLKYIFKNNKEIMLMSDLTPSGSIVFNRYPFDVEIEESQLNNISEIISSKEYKTEQINTKKFKEEFLINPLKAVIKPPMNISYKYLWEIRKLL